MEPYIEGGLAKMLAFFLSLFWLFILKETIKVGIHLSQYLWMHVAAYLHILSLNVDMMIFYTVDPTTYGVATIVTFELAGNLHVVFPSWFYLSIHLLCLKWKLHENHSLKKLIQNLRKRKMQL